MDIEKSVEKTIEICSLVRRGLAETPYRLDITTLLDAYIDKMFEEAGREVVSVEIQARAIELIRSGEIKNPNDLVLKLGIPLDVAENLF